MEQETEQDEIKPLIFNYIFHFILFALILAMHLIIYDKIYWIFSSSNVIYSLGTYLNILYSLFPIYPLVIIFLRKYQKKQFQLLKKFTSVLLIFTIIFGLMVSIAILINTLNSKIFCKECPFNLTIAHLKAALEKYYEKHNTKELCKSRRCVLDREEPEQKYPYYYLCNYDPRDEFNDGDIYTRLLPDGTEVSVNSQLKCQYISSNQESIYFTKSELNSYLDLCYQDSYFFLCQRFTQPEKFYDLDLELTCPETNYYLLIIIFTVLVILIDIIISILPWTIEYISINRIIVILSINRIKVNSVNSTAKSSHISNDEVNFKKEKTPILIIAPSDEININNENQNNNDNKKKFLFLNQSNLKESSIDLKNAQETGKNPIKIFSNKQLQNSERNKLNNKDINNDNESNNEESKAKLSYINTAATKRVEHSKNTNHRLNQIIFNGNNNNH